jgi:predicted nucleotidyltransferase
MNIFLSQHEQFFKCLLDEKVEFIVVGGYAVIFHGYGRTTGDMDLWLRPTNDNKSKFINALRFYHIMEEDLNELQGADFTVPLSFHIGESPNRIDFLTQLSGLNYDEASKHNDYLDLKTYKIPFLRYEDLIVNKLYSNRAKDKADVEELQKIMKLKKDKKL